MTKRKKPTTPELLDYLRNHRHSGDEWAFFAELRAGTGYNSREYKRGGERYNVEQRFDAFAMNMYPSKEFKRIAYEVKISRSDFLREIKTPDKRRAAVELSNQFWFVTPRDIVKDGEIPEECGHLIIDYPKPKPDGKTSDHLRLRVAVRAPVREAMDMPIRFIASILRRSSHALNLEWDVAATNARWRKQYNEVTGNKWYEWSSYGWTKRPPSSSGFYVVAAEEKVPSAVVEVVVDDGVASVILDGQPCPIKELDVWWFDEPMPLDALGTADWFSW